MKSLNFPMMFESMSTEQSIVNQGTIAHPMLHNRAERTTDFALALQQLFENQDSVELVELELASIAQWDDELSQLLHAEEWRKDDWDVLTQWVASLVPLTQENIDWMHEYAHTLSLLAERVELEQQRLYERTEHLTSGQDGGSMQIKQADQPVQHEAKTAQPFYSLLNQSQANDPQGQDERSVVQLLQTLQKVAVETVINFSPVSDQLNAQVPLQQAERLLDYLNLIQVADFTQKSDQSKRPLTPLPIDFYVPNPDVSIEKKVKFDEPLQQSMQQLQDELTAGSARRSIGTRAAETLPETMPDSVAGLRYAVPSYGEEIQLPLTNQQLVTHVEHGSQPFISLSSEEVQQVNTLAQDVVKPVPAAPIEQFQEAISKLLVQKWQVTQTNGVTEAKMKLFPEQLGHLDITIRLHHGQMVAQFVADSLAGKELLESQLYQLRTSLQSQGIQVDRLEVLHQSEQQLYQEQHHQMQSEQQRSGQPGKQMNDEQTFEDGYEDMLAKTGRTKENVLVHGGTFDASV